MHYGEIEVIVFFAFVYICLILIAIQLGKDVVRIHKTYKSTKAMNEKMKTCKFCYYCKNCNTDLISSESFVKNTNDIITFRCVTCGTISEYDLHKNGITFKDDIAILNNDEN